MFVVKDLRKVAEIVADPKDAREQMRLGRRSSEFQGNLRILCTPANIPAFSRLTKLSLYDNQLTSIEGIGLLESTPLSILDLGQNRLEHLPDEIGCLRHLKELWLSNNWLTSIPDAVVTLPLLNILHLSNNRIKHIPSTIGAASSLQVLSLDNNQLEDVADEIGQCVDLVELNVRGNQITSLPLTLGNCKELVTLAVSSNALKILPETLGKCHHLTTIQANGNPIAYFPTALIPFTNLRVNLANTAITTFDVEVASKWRVLSHLHITAKESTPSDDTSVLIVSGTPYAKLAMAKK
ncbi:hypothetical protein H310_14237 [Aphanomyces invadans]|uniref:Disease resistance R13L4/SHOC-2-like LRR domain-containing protein n=1 Tax=Aphanomyces invadans TaxID=157072 RepID=A0A024TAP0_9STRA|nr:hypothetical protein H310_14237 [Aphanomyces invadans]ETV91074.1 hypothetical protein H310_14237 [Aphanomyces invadans]|eukprot:XP_008880270.1 hypothetical protein H310_14237 [Aphanomyces invadans]